MKSASLLSANRKLAWQEDGSGDAAVLMLHSGGLSGRQWRKLAEFLAPHFRVIVPDLLGYGASDPWPPGEPFQLRQDLDALDALLRDLPTRTHLVGHSYGGMLALQLLRADSSRFARVALYEPTAFGVLDADEDADAIANLHDVRLEYTADTNGADENWLRAFVEWWNGPGAWSALNDDVRQTFRRSSWKLHQEVLALAADRTSRAEYRAIENDVLLLGGSRTPLAERRALERLRDALPHATLHLFDGVGHMAPLTHAAMVNAAIASHLSPNWAL